MKFSIIVPSYNQEHYIQQTLENIIELKKQARSRNIDIELLLFDSESIAGVQQQLQRYKDSIDYLEIKKDKGQYDAINKGIATCSGDYWTWLNTDDLLEVEGFFKVAEILAANPKIDYIYGGVIYINEQQETLKSISTWDLDLHGLVSRQPSVFQPGSWFKKQFTDQVGLLAPYSCCFDYEYILRLLKHHAVFYRCDFPVSRFRFYAQSKTGSNTTQFISEQLEISRLYGRRWYHYLGPFLRLRQLKHFLFPRR